MSLDDLRSELEAVKRQRTASQLQHHEIKEEMKYRQAKAVVQMTRASNPPFHIYYKALQETHQTPYLTRKMASLFQVMHMIERDTKQQILVKQHGDQMEECLREFLTNLEREQADKTNEILERRAQLEDEIKRIKETCEIRLEEQRSEIFGLSCELGESDVSSLGSKDGDESNATSGSLYPSVVFEGIANGLLPWAPRKEKRASDSSTTWSTDTSSRRRRSLHDLWQGGNPEDDATVEAQ